MSSLEAFERMGESCTSERRAGAETLKQEGEQPRVGFQVVRAEVRVVEALADGGVQCKDFDF